MSDTHLAFCPRDAFFVPSRESREQALALLSTFSPEREQISDVVHHAPKVYNLESATTLTCAACGRSGALQDGEYSSVHAAFYKQLPIEELLKLSDFYRDFRNPADLDFSMPCCGSVLPFARLKFNVPVAVCSYYLLLVNPGYDDGLSETDSERVWAYENEPYLEKALLTSGALMQLEEALGCELIQLYLPD